VIDPRAIDWRLPLALGSIVAIDQAAALGALGLVPRGGAQLGARVTGGLLTVVVASAVLMLARWAWLRTAFVDRHPSVGVLSAALAVHVGLTVSRHVLVDRGVLERQIGLPLGELVFLTAVTIVVLLFLGALRTHRELLTGIDRTTARLSAAHAAGTTGIIEERARLTAQVRELLEQRLGPTSMRAALFTPQRLQAVADEVLRPLSHQLATTPADLRVEAPPGRAARLSVALRALRPMPVLRPGLLAATMGILVFRFSITPPSPEVLDRRSGAETGGPDLTVTVEWASLLESLALHAATVLIVLVGARRLVRRLERHEPGIDRPATPAPGRSLARAWVDTVLTLTLLGFASLVVLRLVFGLPGFAGLPPVTPAVAVGFVAPLLLVTAVLSVLRAAEDTLELLRGQLDAANDGLARAVARANALLDHERRLFARHLHASVQAAVNAASLTLERATVDGTIGPEVVTRAGESIDAAIERLLDDPSTTEHSEADGSADLDARLAAIVATWEGLAAVGLRLVDPVRARLAADAVGRATLCDLVAEACANAVIHGHARRIDVTVTAAVPDALATDASETNVDALTLRVGDDGRAPGPQRRNGLGSRILTTSCTAWQLEHREDGTTLTATLPLR
jgi:signal transduction histidine kinase